MPEPMRNQLIALALIVFDVLALAALIVVGEIVIQGGGGYK